MLNNISSKTVTGEMMPHFRDHCSLCNLFHCKVITNWNNKFKSCNSIYNCRYQHLRGGVIATEARHSFTVYCQLCGKEIIDMTTNSGQTFFRNNRPWLLPTSVSVFGVSPSKV